mgnify:FL=1
MSLHKPRHITAMAHVRDVAASAAWYEKLGFAMEHQYAPEGEPCWAWLSAGPGGAQLMLTKANPPVDPHSQGVLFYLYYDDVQAAHAQAGAAGFRPGELSYPFYCPKGEFRLTDPDGYCLVCTHAG